MMGAGRLAPVGLQVSQLVADLFRQGNATKLPKYAEILVKEFFEEVYIHISKTYARAPF